MKEQSASILIVDDTADNLRLLASMLTKHGFKVRNANDGLRAITSIKLSIPDLILLDVLMPGLNGYEVCSRLKANPETAEIPIIFISALDGAFDKVKAFEVGGVDYITKPFKLAEVIARVSTQIELSRLHNRLKEQNLQLVSEITAKEKAQKELELLMRTVSHDLTNPLASMKYLLSSLVNQAGDRKNEKNVVVDSQILSVLLGSCDRSLSLIESMVKSSQVPTGSQSLFQTISLYQLVKEIYVSWMAVYNQHQASLAMEIPRVLPTVQASPEQLSRVFDNLLSNALKYNPPGVKVTISAQSIDQDRLRVTIADNGVGISEPEKVFDPYYHVQSEQFLDNGHDLGLNEGLGLYICQQIILEHGGDIGVESSDLVGSTFWFTLPVSSSPGSNS